MTGVASSPLFPSRKVAQALARAHAFLAGQGVPAYLVGGYLRDHLLGRPSKDIDLAVAGDGLEAARGLAHELKGRVVPLDEGLGVARIVLGRGPGRWHLDMTGFSGSLEEDLGRRDFTMNALALGLGEALAGSLRLTDPFGGQGDIQARLIRAISEAVFREDPARLLRAVRLASQLRFRLEPETAVMVKSHAGLIAGVARERVREELNGIMAGPGAAVSLLCLDSLGLLDLLLPEVTACKGVAQPPEHYWDVFRHSVEAVAAVEALLRQSQEAYAAAGLAPWDERLSGYFHQEVAQGVSRGLLIKWAALLHDIAKPVTKTTEAGGRIRFLGHSQIGAEAIRAILGRLRFSSKEIRLVAAMVEHHLRPGQLLRLDEPSRRATYRYFRDAGDAGLDTLFLLLADYLATRGPALDLGQWQRDLAQVASLVEHYFQEREAVPRPRLIDGHLLMAKLGLSPGPLIGRLLKAVEEAQATGEVSTHEEALALVERLLNGSGASPTESLSSGEGKGE